MAETLSYLMLGFQEVLVPTTLLMTFIGVVMGTVVGVLPGLGPSAALSVLLPMVYGKEAVPSLAMLAGIYYGAMFGGMITSISINVPGESASVVTSFDGYPLAKQGKAGMAMGISAISSFCGGTFGIILLTIMGAALAKFALAFGPPEYFAIYLFTFVAIMTIGSGGKIIESAIALIFGLLISCIGLDVMTGTARLTFGSVNLLAGVDFLPAVVGLFGLSEIVLSLSEGEKIEIDKKKGNYKQYSFKNVFPKLHDFIHSLPAIIRGGVVGFIVGVLPGAGATIATFLTYNIEKRVSKDPDSFGKGNIRGVAVAEAANNGAASGAFVPLLTLGIPGSATTAILIGAFIMVGITPGPALFSEHPDVAWGLISSMYVGNVMLIIITTAFIPFFIWVLGISQKTLPIIVASLCVVGTYSLNNSVFDVLLMLVFTVIGLFMKKLEFPVSPVIIAIVLGGDLEFAFRQSLQLFQGNIFMSFTRPICVVLYLLSLLLIALPVVGGIKKRLAAKSQVS